VFVNVFISPYRTDSTGRAKRLSVFMLRLEGAGARVTHTAESCSTVSISVHEVEKNETLLTRIRVFARVNIFPIVSNTYPLKHLHVYNSLTSSCSSTTKAEKHIPPQISLSVCGSAGNQIFTFLQVLLNQASQTTNRPKHLETCFMKSSSWERQPTSKITILVSPRETDENKNDIKGSSQIKGDEFLAALNARLSPGIEIDIN